MTFSKWLENRLCEDEKKLGLEIQAAKAAELAKAGDKPNPAAIARQIVNNPKVARAASVMNLVKPDEMKIKTDIDKTIKTQQQMAKMQQVGQAKMV